MSINLIVANVSGSLDAHLKKIDDAFSISKKYLQENIKLDCIDVVCLDNPSMCIKEIGVGGYTPSRHLSYLYIDPSVEIDTSELVYTLCHELSHAKRFDTCGHGVSLFDSFIFEGLATAFEEEAGSSMKMPRSYVVKTVTEYNQIENLMSYAKAYYDVKDFNYHQWFISGFDEVPRWGGYMIGYKLVTDYLKKHNKKASELLLEDSKIFLM